MLSGPSERASLTRIYVGEAESIRPRLEYQAGEKDFWTMATFFVSKDDSLNKAHVQYLEARLVQLAQQAKRCELDNAAMPSLPSLSEADRADVEGFLDEMLMCFPLLGLDVFERPPGLVPEAHMLRLTGKGAEASGYESADGFVVTSGSQTRATEVPSIHAYLSDLRAALAEQGVLLRREDHLVFSQDYEFNSPSTAAGVVLGRSANGRIEWKDEQGRTLKEIQQQEVSEGES